MRKTRPHKQYLPHPRPDPEFVIDVRAFVLALQLLVCELANSSSPSLLRRAQMLPPMAYASDSSTSICEKFVHSSVNKIRSPVNVVKVRRPHLDPSSSRRETLTVYSRSHLHSGHQRDGEFSPDHKVESSPSGTDLLSTSRQSCRFVPPSILLRVASKLTLSSFALAQAHDTPIRAISWARSSRYLLSSDDSGQIKYFQSNMNNLKALPGHAGHSCRGLAFGSGDSRFVSAGDDGFIRIWGFDEQREERGWRGKLSFRASLVVSADDES